MKLASLLFLGVIVSMQICAAPYKTTADFKADVIIANGSAALPIPSGSVVEIAQFDAAKETQTAEFNAFKFEVPTSLLQVQVVPAAESRKEPVQSGSVATFPVTEIKPVDKAVSKPSVSAVASPAHSAVSWKASDPSAPQLLQYAEYTISAPDPTPEGYAGVVIILNTGSVAQALKIPVWQKFAHEHRFILFGVGLIGEVPAKLSPKLGKTIKESLNVALEKLQKAQGGIKITCREHYLIYGSNLGAEIAGMLPTQDFPSPDQLIAAGFEVGGYGLSLDPTPYTTKIPYLICMGRFGKPEIFDATLKNYQAGLGRGAAWTLAVPNGPPGLGPSQLVAAFFDAQLSARVASDSNQLKQAEGKFVDAQGNSVGTNADNFLPDNSDFLEKLKKFKN